MRHLSHQQKKTMNKYCLSLNLNDQHVHKHKPVKCNYILSTKYNKLNSFKGNPEVYHQPYLRPTAKSKFTKNIR